MLRFIFHSLTIEPLDPFFLWLFESLIVCTFDFLTPYTFDFVTSRLFYSYTFQRPNKKIQNTVSPVTCHMSLREAIQKKICFCLVFFNLALTPPPVFWNPLRNLFLNLILYDIKFLKVFGLLLFPQIYLEKCPSQNKTCSSSSLESGRPPPLLKNFQT